MMDAKRTFTKLEQIYARRRKIEAARQAMLDKQFSDREQKINALETRRDLSEKDHETDIEGLLRSATTARHYHTLLSALAAKKVQHHGDMAVLRHATLREREAQDKTREEVATQRHETRNAARRAEKMKVLLEAELIADEALREVGEEEEAAEAQVCAQVSHAR
ncbi:MAG: hypothetical protein KBT70_11070 [Roseovarius sp.]|uniref:hypothetical protein n=1 Tax=Roseovarius sp. TaxID=1486281 RepID=UPI001B5337FC|nr:hypothetical protein [Roseovarius sp.]MBQ0750729.1 hypothetical protein [Roseovarius sp.]MBQ0811854.1 hypothetical protein [Roseovarius sp.]